MATRLEAWRDRSLWFDNLYASGTRSARGIEAVVTGFPPTRASSVIKLAGAQQGFFTIARALKAEGYATVFVYGGDSAFDNMRRFFLNNGFDAVIDLADLAPSAGFQTTWGVADEDLFHRVHAEMLARGTGDRPVFLLAFTTSNHTPFAFPAGRVEPVEAPVASPANAARYADWAAADYLERAAAGPYWDRTVFMLVADHDARSDGDTAVPVVDGYHIPAFLTGGPVRPRTVTRIASQIDLLPTALSVMGIAARVPATGLDLSRPAPPGPGHAIMQFHDNQAYRRGDDVVMLVPGRPAQQYRIHADALLPVAADPALVHQAQAVAAWPLFAYRDGSYRADVAPTRVAASAPSASNATAAATPKVLAGPRLSQTRPAPAPPASSATAVTKPSTPSAVPRRSGGQASTATAASTPWVAARCSPQSTAPSTMPPGPVASASIACVSTRTATPASRTG